MKSNEIRPWTRWIAVIVVPFLWLAFLILYFLPDTTGEHFAWEIKPHMTALYMGAGYLGGSWLFLNAILGKRWHRIQAGFLPITAFTWFMMFATFLHWDKFSHGRLGFTLWLILYVVTPFLVPTLWFFNRNADSGQPEEDDVLLPSPVPLILKFAGYGGLIIALVGFIYPDFVIQIWPWTLTPLTARVMCGWLALLGVGALTMSSESRWSAWKVPLESIVIWHVLVFVAAILNPDEFKTSIFNWYTISIGAVLAGIIFFYSAMEKHKQQPEAPNTSP